MSSTLRISYLILHEPKIDMIKYITIDSSQTVLDLRNAIELQNGLVAGQIDIQRVQKVAFSVKDEAIYEKLQNFTFTSIANNWNPTSKLSAIIMPADLPPDHLHLIIRA